MAITHQVFLSSGPHGYNPPGVPVVGLRVRFLASESGSATRQAMYVSVAETAATGPGAPHPASGAAVKDWICPACNNSNWPVRVACNKCQLPRPAGFGNDGASATVLEIGTEAEGSVKFFNMQTQYIFPRPLKSMSKARIRYL